MLEDPRIGVYVCHCGLNIAGIIDVYAVIDHAKKLPNVVVAKDYVFTCSAPGQDIIKQDVKEHKLDRVVVAACSPSMHESTFRDAIQEAGLNKYLLEMANIREHCSWVHPQEREEATQKAKDLVRMGVAKLRLMEPLEKIEFEVQPCALILGGGVAGMNTAQNLAEKGYEVYLVEKSPTLGGTAARIGKLYYSDKKGSELAKILIDSVKSNSKIHIFSNSEIEKLDGSVGNFKAQININPRFVNEKCNLCGECVNVCPEEVPNEYEFGLNKRKAIYLPFAEAYPSAYVIDPKSCTKCGKCIEVCKPEAINLDEKPNQIEAQIGCNVLATGYSPYEPPEGEYGYGKSPNIVTLFQLERMLDSSGPTKGELILDGKVPKSMAFILCVGSLNTTPNSNAYCSRMCCSSSLKNVQEIKNRYPDTSIYVLYKDIRTYGKMEERLYESAAENLVPFLKFDQPPQVDVNSGGAEVKVYDTTSQENLLLPVDMVVLTNGMGPSESLEKVKSIVKVGCSPEGFIREAHLKLRPVETPSDGIFLAGTVTSPKNIIESITTGGASAAKAAGLISKKQVEVEPIIATVNEDTCSGCAICIATCPYDAISRVEKNGKKQASVDSTLCKSCGTCAAACPSGSMQQYGFKDKQVIAQVVACLERGE
jgi:heterodisulfide reductase subunit A